MSICCHVYWCFQKNCWEKLYENTLSQVLCKLSSNGLKLDTTRDLHYDFPEKFRTDSCKTTLGLLLLLVQHIPLYLGIYII